jgi:protease-4
MDEPHADHEAAAPPHIPPRESRRSRAWVWWLLGVVLLTLGACVLISVVTTMAALQNGSGLGAVAGETNPLEGRVAVVYLTSPIAGVGNSGLLGGATVSPERIITQLRRADADPTVKSVLLRIDSPGGTASASEEIAQAISETKKPVIASIGDMGASGAYMAAAQADQIWSTGASDVGSIGVILELTEYGDLLKKLGVNQFAITAGKYKGVGAPWGTLTTQERAMLQADIDLVYGQFIDWVAKGRKMDKARVRELATGWAWPGQRAKELGLVDHLGNYSDALVAAGKAGGISGYPATVDFESGGLGGFFSGLAGGLGFTPPATPAQTPAPKGTYVPIVPR